MNILPTLLFVVLLTMPVYSQSFFCSTFCGANSCSGIGADTCTGCATNWVTSGVTCAPATGFTQIDKSTDISGTMDFNPSTTTTAGGYTYIGDIPSANSVTVTLAGMTQPHFSI